MFFFTLFASQFFGKKFSFTLSLLFYLVFHSRSSVSVYAVFGSFRSLLQQMLVGLSPVSTFYHAHTACIGGPRRICSPENVQSNISFDRRKISNSVIKNWLTQYTHQGLYMVECQVKRHTHTNTQPHTHASEMIERKLTVSKQSSHQFFYYNSKKFLNRFLFLFLSWFLLCSLVSNGHIKINGPKYVYTRKNAENKLQNAQK